MNQQMSLFIPRVFSTITEERVKKTFESLDLGKVKRVDFVAKLGGYNSVYVHFEYWYNTSTVQNFQDRVRNVDKPARIVYDDPWFWIVLENKTKKYISGARKPTLILDEPKPTNNLDLTAEQAQFMEDCLAEEDRLYYEEPMVLNNNYANLLLGECNPYHYFQT